MILISRITKYLIVSLALVPASVWAQSSQTLSVSPTLFEMQANPGQAWTSHIRVINVNDYPLTVYPEPVNFKPLGEDGRGDLIPIFSEETQGQTLAEWISVPKDPVIIPPQATVEVPLQVNVPENAPPCGHYAAIMIGTKPPTEGQQISQVQTAQFVTSLFFVKVAGLCIEDADIREFVTAKRVVQEPKITLDMRFENTGTVHVQPQGDIKIFNMWGKERGVIPINQQTHFGNVLPHSIRKFSFGWTGETALYDIGRYKAVATIGYGDEGKKFVTSTTYFWVIPYTTILVTVIVLILAIRLGLWLIRRYIERMLALSGVNVQHDPYVPMHARSKEISENTVVIKRYGQVTAPVKASVFEATKSWKEAIGISAKSVALYQYFRNHAKTVLAIVVVLVVIVIIIIALMGILKKNAHYEISINTSGADVVMSSEDIAYEKLRLTKVLPSEQKAINSDIRIKNISGEVGAGANVRFRLEQEGYPITELSVDAERHEDRTIIIYPQKEQELALALSKLLTGAMLSASDKAEGDIVIYAGRDNLNK